jgi:hypothetical protein
MGGGELPTRAEWVEEFSKKNNTKDKIRVSNSEATVVQGRK